MFKRLFGGRKQHPVEKKERLTQCARCVLASAQKAAEEFHDSAVRAEHILLGIIRENDCTANHVLKALNIPFETLERALREMSKPATTNKPVMELAPDVKRMLEIAVDEARRRNQSSIGTEHLLLAIVYQRHTVAFEALAQFGIIPHMVRDKVSEVAAQMRESLPSELPSHQPTQAESQEQGDQADAPLSGDVGSPQPPTE